MPAAVTARVAVEAAVTDGWWKYVGSSGAVVGVNVSTAGNQVSFLVPVSRVRALIERAAPQPPSDDDLHGDLAAQLRANQDRIAARLLGKPLPVAELNGYRVAGDRIEDAIYAASKVERQKKVGALRDEVEAAIKEQHPEVTDFEIEQVFEYIQKKAFLTRTTEAVRVVYYDVAVEILKQPQYVPMPVEEQVMIIWAAENGYLDDVPIEKVNDFESEFHVYMRDRYPQIGDEIRTKQVLGEELEAKLKEAVEAYHNMAVGTKTT